jgi:SAM-dependent methyltransferase
VALSPRLQAVVDALPLRPGLRVVEVGGAPGAAAREVARRVAPGGFVLVVDRSPRGVEAVRRTARAEIEAGLLGVRIASAEDVALEPGEAAYDLAFACRVGVLDGRHPAGHERAVTSLRAMLVPGGPILVDTGDPLRRLD